MSKLFCSSNAKSSMYIWKKWSFESECEYFGSASVSIESTRNPFHISSRGSRFILHNTMKKLSTLLWICCIALTSSCKAGPLVVSLRRIHHTRLRRLWHLCDLFPFYLPEWSFLWCYHSVYLSSFGTDLSEKKSKELEDDVKNVRKSKNRSCSCYWLFLSEVKVWLCSWMWPISIYFNINYYLQAALVKRKRTSLYA